MPSCVPGCVSDPKPSMFLHSLLPTLITHCPPSFGVDTLCRLPGGSHIYLAVWRRKVVNRRFTRLLLPPRLPGCSSCPPTPSSCGTWTRPLTPPSLLVCVKWRCDSTYHSLAHSKRSISIICCCYGLLRQNTTVVAHLKINLTLSTDTLYT